jgi:glycerophosphoryl diester phosphodiesterase
VRVTKDGGPILHHDHYLRDPAGGRLKISHQTYEQLLRHKPDLPTLQQVLDDYGGKIPLYLEIKPGEPTKPIVNILKNYLNNGGRPESLRISSYSLPVLRSVKAALPEITLAVLHKWSGVVATKRARQLGTQHIIFNQRWLWSGFVKAMARAGYKVGAYTVNTTQRARKLESYGVRAIFTDYPDRFKGW